MGGRRGKPEAAHKGLLWLVVSSAESSATGRAWHSKNGQVGTNA